MKVYAPEGMTDLLDREARYTVDGWGSDIAFYCAGNEIVADGDTEWSGYGVATGMVLMVMVGDDREFPTDPDDCKEISEDDYCHECGQIGCKGDFR